MNGKPFPGAASPSIGRADSTRLIDELLRRALRIGDPNNPAEVATALARRYADGAARIEQESLGLAVSGGASRALLRPVEPTVAGDTPGDREYARVEANLQADLAALIDSPANREWRPELLGWRSAILREFAEAAGAARYSQDPAQRERAMLGVRKLTEFARLARLVGVLNLEMTCPYRRLATSCDEAASAVRILSGEALYRAGLQDGGLMLNVSAIDLRIRRDALINALRRLTDTEQVGDDDWGEGLYAYGQLLAALERSGASDLKTYLRETSLAAALDGIVEDAAGAAHRMDAEVLRRMASTVPVEIARLKRLLDVAKAIEPQLRDTVLTPGADVASADLSRFIQALQLFVDGFGQTRSGSRLIDLAVPLPMAARQADEADGAARLILRILVSLRGEYAQSAECFLQCCGCNGPELRQQVQIDKVLYDLDRAIDLYALGEDTAARWVDSEDWQKGRFTNEQRAAVYGIVAANLAEILNAAHPDTDLGQILAHLRRIEETLRVMLPEGWRLMRARFPNPPNTAMTDQVIADLRDAIEAASQGDGEEVEIENALSGSAAWAAFVAALPDTADETALLTELVTHVLRRRPLLTDVLGEQHRAEHDWKALVETMAARCLGKDPAGNLILAGTDLLVANPDFRGKAPVRRAARPPIPPDRASLFRIAEDGVRTRYSYNDSRMGSPGPAARPAGPTAAPRPERGEAAALRRDRDAALVELADKDLFDSVEALLQGMFHALSDVLEALSREEKTATAVGELRTWIKRLREGTIARPRRGTRPEPDATIEFDFLGWDERSPEGFTLSELVAGRHERLARAMEDLLTPPPQTAKAFSPADLKERMNSFRRCQKLLNDARKQDRG